MQGTGFPKRHHVACYVLGLHAPSRLSAYGGHIRVSTLRLGGSPIDDLTLARHGVYKPASNGTPDGAPDSSQQRTLTAFDG
jgi:hypothetical protein